ncbi:putative cell wall biogenesis protein Ecm15 [Talaromyces proteolyticus]|uniref:Cell wall biogenesis protein Ecm15 n=1 Tax=Talaromyces proteolyticus TaxID=1131652 RepID=A0AAD4L211_9EURO|nr:putative cell wall biogenesis protein Ecm15 [Talaromyces proteolyticus]KAH8704176.1 putative cell wall biogenesis protein Ecm15 [Talaromyces proteolyticus]
MSSSTSDISLSNIPTPEHCTADFCLIPIGTGSASVSAQIADVQRLVERSGLKYVMHSAGTTLEGPWEKVHKVIGQAHTILHQQGVVRIQSDIRSGSRTDKIQSFEDKVAAVNKLLGKE